MIENRDKKLVRVEITVPFSWYRETLLDMAFQFKMIKINL